MFCHDVIRYEFIDPSKSYIYFFAYKYLISVVISLCTYGTQYAHQCCP